jgi:hypothetical protein
MKPPVIIDAGPLVALIYADVPMSLADACLVRMSELFPKHRVMSLGSDFHVYRRNRLQVIPLLSPA